MLESSQQVLQLCFNLHFNWSFAQEVMGIQSGKSPNLGNFRTLDLGVQGKMTFGCSPYG
jgi:hypothetical protein